MGDYVHGSFGVIEDMKLNNQVVLPALLEQTQARQLMKFAVRKWCEVSTSERIRYRIGERIR